VVHFKKRGDGMLGGIIESYFDFFYYCLAVLMKNIFKIDMEKKIKEEAGLKYRMLKELTYIMAYIIGIFVLILVSILIMIIVFLINYYL
jgi:lipopolysaccharide/colanic/teichoic acid biosynthesis glycosyltransferase